MEPFVLKNILCVCAYVQSIITCLKSAWENKWERWISAAVSQSHSAAFSDMLTPLRALNVSPY